MNKVYLDGKVVHEIDWDLERFKGSAIHSVGKCLFHTVLLYKTSHWVSRNYAIALAAVLGYPDHEAYPIGDAFGDIELKPRGEI